MARKINIEKLRKWQNSNDPELKTLCCPKYYDLTDDLHNEGVLTPTAFGWQCPECGDIQEYGKMEQMISDCRDEFFEGPFGGTKQ